MNVEDLLRNELHSEANSVTPIDGLLEASTIRGRRKQHGRRLAVAGSSVAAAAIVVGGSLVIAGGGGNTSRVTPAGTAPAKHHTARTEADPSLTPWWQTWTEGRHFGPVDQSFLTNSRPSYDDGHGPYAIKVWATGSEPDGTDWLMFTDAHDGNVVQYRQGWDGQPDYGDSPQIEQPGLTWDSFMSPTLASHNKVSSSSQYLIIVGKPGTTSISYAADGSTFVDEPVHDGISVIKLGNFPPSTAQVELATADGVYATGTPSGAGAGETSSTPDPGAGTAIPTATPSRPSN